MEISMSKFHGITHHSPTALNLAAAQLPLYFVERVLKRRSPASCAMHRGTASEAGIVHGLVHPDAALQECQDLALVRFDMDAALSGDPNRTKERDAIPGIVEQGLLALRPYGVPDEIQLRRDFMVEGVVLPFLGFCDLGWSQHGIRLDIKSQLALSSDASEPHRRQVACYLHDTNLEGRLAYITPRKHGVYKVQDPRADMTALIEIAKRVERFLALSTDPQELAALLIPDYSSFYFNNPVTRQHCREIFGW